jgi:branched-chain amino acid transport system substrate-binding protein
MANSIDPTEVRTALARLKFMSFYGNWAINEAGLQVGHSMVDMQWQGGKRVIVWPPEAATGKLYYPMPTFAEKAAGKVAVPN